MLSRGVDVGINISVLPSSDPIDTSYDSMVLTDVNRFVQLITNSLFNRCRIEMGISIMKKKKIINSLRNIIEYMILIGTYFDKTYMEEDNILNLNLINLYII